MSGIHHFPAFPPLPTFPPSQHSFTLRHKMTLGGPFADMMIGGGEEDHLFQNLFLVAETLRKASLSYKMGGIGPSSQN